MILPLKNYTTQNIYLLSTISIVSTKNSGQWQNTARGFVAPSKHIFSPRQELKRTVYPESEGFSEDIKLFHKSTLYQYSPVTNLVNNSICPLCMCYFCSCKKGVY